MRLKYHLARLDMLTNAYRFFYLNVLLIAVHWTGLNRSATSQSKDRFLGKEDSVVVAVPGVVMNASSNEAVRVLVQEIIE